MYTGNCPGASRCKPYRQICLMEEPDRDSLICNAPRLSKKRALVRDGEQNEVGDSLEREGSSRVKAGMPRLDELIS